MLVKNATVSKLNLDESWFNSLDWSEAIVSHINDNKKIIITSFIFITPVPNQFFADFLQYGGWYS